MLGQSRADLGHVVHLTYGFVHAHWAGCRVLFRALLRDGGLEASIGFSYVS